MSKYQNSTDLQVEIYHLMYGVGLLLLIEYISDGLVCFLPHDNRGGHLADQAELRREHLQCDEARRRIVARVGWACSRSPARWC